MTRCGYLILYWINIFNKHCVKGNLFCQLLTFHIFDQITKILIEALKWKYCTRNGCCSPTNPILEVLHIILSQVDPKLIFVMSAGGHLGFMQITKIAQSGHKGNQAGIVLGPPRNTNHQKNVIRKNISRSHNEFVKRSNRLILVDSKMKEVLWLGELSDPNHTTLFLQPCTLTRIPYGCTQLTWIVMVCTPTVRLVWPSHTRTGLQESRITLLWKTVRRWIHAMAPGTMSGVLAHLVTSYADMISSKSHIPTVFLWPPLLTYIG